MHIRCHANHAPSFMIQNDDVYQQGFQYFGETYMRFSDIWDKNLMNS